MRIGIDLGGMSIKAGIVDDSFNIIYKETVPTDVDGGEEKLCDDIVSLARRVRMHSGENKISSIGIGVPGNVDNETKRVIYCNNIPLSQIDLRATIERETGIVTFIDNDANVAAFGETIAGAARDYSDVVMVTIGTGIGCGIIINNKIYHGVNGAAGELGHCTIEMDGLKCKCGRYGCYELYASATALIRMTCEAMELDRSSAMWEFAGCLSEVSGKTAFDAYRAGDSAAERVVLQYIKYLSAGLCNVINIFQPEALIIGGGISKEGDFLVEKLSEIIERERYSRANRQSKLLIAELGNDAGIIGASQLS